MGSETSDMGISWNVIGKLFMALQLSNIGFHDQFMAIYPLVSSNMTGKSGETYGEDVFMVNIYSIYYS